ncbi:MAG: glycosyltransferase [Candidatus Cloacimonetes bacterium]|nr:glycosyltransferase [Candidatus Cloacimonadota bacterium]
MNKISCSVGIFAHNEAGNIIHLLEALVGQILEKASLTEIIVVSSASTDGTDSLVRDFATLHSQVKLITQARREGKSAAINLFLKEAGEDICAVISGDVIPEKHTLEKLLEVFSDPQIGASGGRPMPVNSTDSFCGYAVQLLWNLHHRMALISPKLGEMIVFRKVMETIPADSAVDEASIEALIKARGLKLKYVPGAIIRNKGPEKLKDFIKQRRRIQNGHLWLKRYQHYQVASQEGSTLLKVFIAELTEHPSAAFRMLGVMALEAFSRILGSWDYYIKGKNPFAWEIVSSAKKTQ